MGSVVTTAVNVDPYNNYLTHPVDKALTRTLVKRNKSEIIGSPDVIARTYQVFYIILNQAPLSRYNCVTLRVDVLGVIRATVIKNFIAIRVTRTVQFDFSSPLR